jgi:uncharacterized protein YbbK (DUF523 family)
MKLVVSACLAGRPCRYDGAAKPNADVTQALSDWKEQGGEVLALCPEELGDLGTPRPPCELKGGDGSQFWRGEAQVGGTEDGVNRSTAFATGATKAVALAKDCQRAILKARSPSCGCGQTWIDGSLQNGDGIFAARLRELGVQLNTEETL